MFFSIETSVTALLLKITRTLFSSSQLEFIGSNYLLVISSSIVTFVSLASLCQRTFPAFTTFLGHHKDYPLATLSSLTSFTISYDFFQRFRSYYYLSNNYDGLWFRTTFESLGYSQLLFSFSFFALSLHYFSFVSNRKSSFTVLMSLFTAAISRVLWVFADDFQYFQHLNNSSFLWVSFTAKLMSSLMMVAGLQGISTTIFNFNLLRYLGVILASVATWTYNLIKSILTKIYMTTKFVIKTVFDHLILPTYKIVKDVSIFTYKNIITPTFKFTRDYILIPSYRAIVFSYTTVRDKIVIPSYNFIKLVILTIGDTSSKTGNYLVENIISPTTKAIIWLSKYIAQKLTDIIDFLLGTLVKTLSFIKNQIILPIVDFVVAVVKWLYASIIIPLANAVYNYIFLPLKKFVNKIIQSLTNIIHYLYVILIVNPSIYVLEFLYRQREKRTLEKIITYITAKFVRFVLDPLVYFIRYFIFNPFRRYLMPFIFPLILTTFGVLFFKNGYESMIKLVSEEEDARMILLLSKWSLQKSIFQFLAGYINLVVAGIIVSDEIGNDFMKKKFILLYQWLDFGLVNVIIYILAKFIRSSFSVASHTYDYIGNIVKYGFRILETITKAVLFGISSVVTQIYQFVIRPILRLFRNIFIIIWKNPLFSLTSSLSIVYLAFEIHQGRITYHHYVAEQFRSNFDNYFSGLKPLVIEKMGYLSEWLIANVYEKGISHSKFIYQIGSRTVSTYYTLSSTEANGWVDLVTQNNVFDLTKHGGFAASLYILHVAINYISYAFRFEGNPTFLCRAAFKSLYYPLFFFAMTSRFLFSVYVYLIQGNSLLIFLIYLITILYLSLSEMRERNRVISINDWRSTTSSTTATPMTNSPTSAEALVKKLQKSKPAKTYVTTECIICLEDFNNNDTDNKEKTVYLPCGHLFHCECVISWLATNTQNRCPFCRTSIESGISSIFL